MQKSIELAEKLISNFSVPENRAEGYLILYEYTNDKKYFKEFKDNIIQLGKERILSKPHWVKALADRDDELLDELLEYLDGGWVDKTDISRREEQFEELRRIVYNLVEYLRSKVDLPHYVEFVFRLISLPFFGEEEKTEYIAKILDKLSRFSP